MSITVTAIHCYPVKSLGGIALQHSTLHPLGMEWDRAWMILDERNQFLSQRNLPRMCLIQTRLTDDALILSCAGKGEVSIPFSAPVAAYAQSEVWGDPVALAVIDSDAGAWLQHVLEIDQPLRLARMADKARRRQSHPERFGAQHSTRFADAAAYLVTNEESLDELNRSLESNGEAAVPMDRFRPNVVIRGMPAFAEQQPGKLLGPGYVLRLCHPAERCVMTTINQQTAARHPDREPFRTLQKINPMPGKPLGPAFGQLSVLHEPQAARITVGDELSFVID